jgi:MerR family transcriptional regulator/heat shock protein HspR
MFKGDRGGNGRPASAIPPGRSTAPGRHDPARPLAPIGVVADLLGVTGQTLRLYERHGLIRPARRRGERFYSAYDLHWLECLRHLIHGAKVSIEGVRRLLRFAPCWEICNVNRDWHCRSCPVYQDRRRPATPAAGAGPRGAPRAKA